jgi:hypothetical protein
MPGFPRLLPRALCLLGCLFVVAAFHGPVTAGEAAREPGVPDPELQAAIDEAIDTGVAWLKGEQSPNGALGGMNASGTLHHELGTTSLAGLALLAGGGARGEDAVDRVYGYLVEKDKVYGGSGGRSTYDTGLLLMFVTAYWRGEESEQAGRGRRPRPGAKNPCNLPAEAQRWIQDLASFLVRARKPATSTWGYPAHRDDHSNTQYAFLGLRAARDCGAKVPSQVFVQSAKTYLERQEPEGPKVPRIVVSTDPNQSDYVVGYDKARGWSYLQEPFLATGAMTTSGIAVLAICHDALTNPARSSLYDSKLERAVTTSVADGFAWLDKHFSVRDNPALGRTWHLYYLYGLERAAIFGGRSLLGKHDWYVEGAKVLVDMQAGDGRWSTGTMDGEKTYEASDVVDTAWAILFLARSTRPMPPIPAPVVTPGD